jgi:hypothetical protein
MLGLNYFRADLPSTAASREREALLWADKAIIGFASTYHRLPCPAAMPNGDEDCTLAKGWLPRELNLDVSAFEPGHLPMRYMVYRDDSPLVTGRDETHRAPSIGTTHTPTPRPLPPYDAYEPGVWVKEATSDPTAIVDGKDSAPTVAAHEGRFTKCVDPGTDLDDPLCEVLDFNARNGLDLCETLRLVGVKLAGGSSTSFAHYQRAGTPVNVAYGLALPGRFDASGDNERFDGANATVAPEMEAPDKAHDSSYDDTVFVRDLDSLMSAFGCQPVAYTVQAQYEDAIAKGSGGSDEVNDFLEDQGEELPETPGADGVLRVDFHRQGVAVLMNESVQSLAFAHDVVTEVQDQYEGLRDDAKQTTIMTSIQAGLSGLGAGVAGLSIAADGIAIAEASAIAAACLGLCANEYAAIALYTAAIVASSVALALNIAATGIQIDAAVDASTIYQRMNGDPADPDIAAAQEAACDAIVEANTARQEAYEQELASARDAEEKTREKMEEAREDLDDYSDDLETAIDGCLNTLASNSSSGLQCNNGLNNVSCSVAGGACSTATYQACFGNALGTTLETNYERFDGGVDGRSIHELYDARAAAYVEYQKIEWDPEATAAQKAAAKAAVDAAEAAIAAFTNDTALPASFTPATSSCNPPAYIRCDYHYGEACGEARTLIQQPVYTIQGGSLESCVALMNANTQTVTNPNGTADPDDDTYEIGNMGEDPEDCSRSLYNWLYDVYIQAVKNHEEAVQRLEKLEADGPPAPLTCAETGGVDGLVEIWSPDDAEEVLRRVDKRSVLQ